MCRSIRLALGASPPTGWGFKSPLRHDMLPDCSGVASSRASSAPDAEVGVRVSRVSAERMRRVTVLAVTALAVGAAVASSPAASVGAQPVPQQFTTPGSASFAVPDGICFVTVHADGGHGGSVPEEAVGGKGAMVAARVTVAPGDTLSLLVAGKGNNSSLLVGGGGGVGGGG